jgi:hypothetical protein
MDLKDAVTSEALFEIDLDCDFAGDPCPCRTAISYKMVTI